MNVSDKPFPLSLTGRDSHTVTLQVGQGGFAIGQAGPKSQRLDAVVPADAAINWACFDGFTTPSGLLWPRGFQYQGADTEFVAWSRTRPIERFSWTPTEATAVDLDGSKIASFWLELGRAKVRVVLGGKMRELGVRGDLTQLSVEMGAGSAMPALFFAPTSLPRNAPIVLPLMPTLADATNVTIQVDVMGSPFDVGSLLQFPKLTTLSLWGDMRSLDRLAGLKQLASLKLRRCRDLSGLPDLATWPQMHSVFVSDVEAVGGRALQAQVEKLKKQDRPLGRISLGNLREASWFANETGMLFATWPRGTAQKATKAYKQAVEDMTAADSAAGIKEALLRFVDVINQLPGIETIERDDVGVAVSKLASLVPSVGADELLRWFDEARDF
jgi:hypothetical protein